MKKRNYNWNFNILTGSQYPRGVQYGYQVANLNQCTVCYNTFYSGITTTAIINSCTGPYLFVGALAKGNASFQLGAYGLATDVQTQTTINTPHLSNGAWWYFTTSQSFGFADVSFIQQQQADVADSDPNSRLSWHLDLNVGGYRAGIYLNRNSDSTVWQKQIYNCPG